MDHVQDLTKAALKLSDMGLEVRLVLTVDPPGWDYIDLGHNLKLYRKPWPTESTNLCWWLELDKLAYEQLASLEAVATVVVRVLENEIKELHVKADIVQAVADTYRRLRDGDVGGPGC